MKCLCNLIAVACLLLLPARLMGATALFDFRTGNVQPGWIEVVNAGTGSSGPISLSTVAVGGVTIDNRDRTGNGGGAESEMWRDFLFANGSNVPGEGLDVTITGLAPQTTYPVRVWSFDEDSNNGRGATWNGWLLTFPDSPDPASLDDYVAKFNVTTDGAGTAVVAGRVYANNGQAHQVFINGLEIGDPLAAPPVPPKYLIDIDSTTGGPIATAPGFTSLDATEPSNGKNVTVDGTTFTVFSADGSRMRTAGGLPLPNQLASDFVYDDGAGQAVGLTVSHLPKGSWEAKVWSWDSSYPTTVGDQIVGINMPGREIIFTDSFAPSANDPFTFRFNSDKLPDGFGIFTRENSDNNRARFNALTLTPVDPPTTLKIDIDVDTPQTQPGWTSLLVSGAAGSVREEGVTFEVFSADGSRDRAGPNPLTRDFVYDDGAGQAVGLRVWDLPDGRWEASVWAWDDSFPTTVGDQIVGITQFTPNSEIIFTNSFVPSATEPFRFQFDSSALPSGFGIFTRENSGYDRARFNALELVRIPEPASLVLAGLGLLALGMAGLRRAWRRR